MKSQDQDMTFDAVKQNHRKLAENPKLSDHNKQVLDDFFRKMGSKGTGQTTLKDYASRFNTPLSSIIDFKLDDAEKEDIEKVVAAINNDEVRKLNGEAYSDYSKDDIWKAVRVFYNKFIKKEGRGYREDLDGPKLVADLNLNIELSTDIDIHTRPTPEHVQKVADKADNLRDRALILFGWATGARIGELGKTAHHHQFPEPIKWEDIRFKDREMYVTLRGKTGRRELPIRASMPIMKQLHNQQNADLSDPVFSQKNQKNICPDCSSHNLTSDRNASYHSREYSCEECEWTGKATEADKKRKPMTGKDMRDTLQRILAEAKSEGIVPKEITKKPHWFWRDGRALYWAAADKNENFLRAFFGWSENSDAPTHYIELMQESVLAGIREDYGEELNDSERKFKDSSLKPWECECGEFISELQKYCPACGCEANLELKHHNSGNDMKEKQEELEKAIHEYMEDSGVINDIKEKIS